MQIRYLIDTAFLRTVLEDGREFRPVLRHERNRDRSIIAGDPFIRTGNEAVFIERVFPTSVVLTEQALDESRILD